MDVFRPRLPAAALAAALGLGALAAAPAPAPAAPPAVAPGRSFLIVQPSGPKDLKTVGPYINRFLGWIEARAGLAGGSFKAFYFPNLDKGEKALVEKKPGFVMPTLGLYLKHREALGLRALVRIEVEGKVDSGWHLVGLGPGAKPAPSLASLAGKRLVWTGFDDPAFVSRVLLEGTALDKFAVTVVPQPVAAVRAVLYGSADLALLSTADLAAARKLPGGAALVVVWNAPLVPNPPVATLGAVAASADVAAVRDGLLAMCGDTAKGGKGICAEFHITGFVAVTDAAYDDVAKKMK